MAPYDFIAEENIKDERLAFAYKLLGACEDIDGAGKYDGFFKGSFNINIDVQRGDSHEHVLIRFPFPGNIYGPWRDNKVTNEVMAMKYLREHTNIPVPPIRSWGVTRESPGPFIIMNLMEGQDLSDFLQQPTQSKGEPIILDPDIEEMKLDFVYDQIAEFMLQISRLEFPHIGAIAEDDTASSPSWAVVEPPLTYDMNEVVTLAGYPADEFTLTAPFDRASDYFTARAHQFQTHLETQRNIAGDDGELAWSQFVARRRFAELIPAYCIDDTGPFRLFCDDLRPTNMLADPDTLRITAVLDFEFTNAMPAQFTYDPPWWLLLKQPGSWVREGKMQEFLDLFTPRKDQFIRAMERAEAKSSLMVGQPCLSAWMRDSWDSGRFWFNLASRKSFDVDEIYWEALHRVGTVDPILDGVTLAEKERFLKQKKAQFDRYREEMESDKRFSRE
ncbi:hypothetical protein BKA65DRAFT_569989 [Rhexocercosporidium sp. MPI-PUGE-AT-0058]|nr:hypothetical protein BKA65DRAFT_569989 [Rhexocercosporidium sp. MPI-PUGE-AT-0058]